MFFKFTVDLTVSDILSHKELLAVNSIGFGLILLAMKARLTYLVSEAYHTDDYIREISYPVVVFVNRISYWGILFILSILVQLTSYFSWTKEYCSVLLNIAFLLTAITFLAFFIYYLQYMLGARLKDRLWFNLWVKSANHR